MKLLPEKEIKKQKEKPKTFYWFSTCFSFFRVMLEKTQQTLGIGKAGE